MPRSEDKPISAQAESLELRELLKQVHLQGMAGNINALAMHDRFLGQPAVQLEADQSNKTLPEAALNLLQQAMEDLDDPRLAFVADAYFGIARRYWQLNSIERAKELDNPPSSQAANSYRQGRRVFAAFVEWFVKRNAEARAQLSTLTDKDGPALVTRVSAYKPTDSFPLFIWTGDQCQSHHLRKSVRVNPDLVAQVKVFFDPARWRQRVRAQSYAGEVFHLASMSITNDFDDDKEVTFAFKSLPYNETVATQALFSEDAKAASTAHAMLVNDGAGGFLHYSPPNSVYVNTSIVDSNGQLLALRRGSATHDSHHVWTLGVCETLRCLDGGDLDASPPTLLQLVRRSLEKEAGLEPDDYDNPSISWIGYNFVTMRGDLLPGLTNIPTANVRLHAQVRAHLTEKDLWERIRENAPDGFEHDDHKDLDWSEETALSIINAVVGERSDDANRIWTPFSALAAQELWRVRNSF